MSTITLKNLPEELHQRLKESAVAHHRSLNREIIARLEAQFLDAPLDAEAKLAELRVLRQRRAVYAVPEEIDALKREGRS